MIVIINPNSTVAMTETLLATARRMMPEAHIEGWTSHDGPPAIQGAEDGAACIPPLLDLVTEAEAAGARIIIIGCFDDTGLAQARAITDCVVLGIGEAAYARAARLGRFSVVTTLPVSVPVLEGNIAALGLTPRCARVRASGVAVLALETDPATAIPQVLAEARTALAEDDIRSVVLGCAGMVDVAAHAPDFPVPLIDGLRAALERTKTL
ncbi:allantoin racemase [Loktanella atrilutea]|uniref:Allantoin racemase n=1 Tax=Loktanella atrilutea TaxID=366533 RepID=A0A1M4WMW5_LOKAT|nr:aspartate/glutamate racemase family protein [Loktanella atrilutea]SHE82566.1 allantoin racemase [Loktanella atrilutea]